MAYDVNGWTIIPSPPGNAIICYVSSSSGSNSNDGTQAHPFQTIAHACAQFIQGRPAWLYLKCGDTWNENMAWQWSGDSSAAPSLFTSYSTGARPIINSGVDVALYMGGGGGAPLRLDYIWVIGIDFYNKGRDPNSVSYNPTIAAAEPDAIELFRDSIGVLFEDCATRFHYVGFNLFCQDTQITDATIRRCIIADSYGLNSRSQGFYLDETTNLLIEECIIDQNGWNPDLTADGSGPSIFNHNIYVQITNTSMTIRNNISTNGSAHGIMQRAGGITSGNFIRNSPIGLSSGNSSGVNSITASVVENNVVMSCTNVFSYDQLDQNGQIEQIAWGIFIDENISSALVQNNIVAHDLITGTNYEAMEINNSNSTIINNIIYDWRGGIVDNSAGATIGANQIIANGAGRLDITRTAETYMASLGQTATFAAFVAAARAQSKASWNTNYTAQSINAYIQAGFALTSGVSCGFFFNA